MQPPRRDFPDLVLSDGGGMTSTPVVVVVAAAVGVAAAAEACVGSSTSGALDISISGFMSLFFIL